MSDLERILPDWISGFMQLTENSEPPILFRKWTAISAIASALQRKVWVEWGTSLIFYPNFYIVLVGPSATGKGTAMGFGLDILREVSPIRLSAQATSMQALIRRLKETNLTDMDLETGKQQYHSSLTILSKEFTVFLGYKNLDMISALCDWYDCDDRWAYETISRDKEEIIGVWVNILGGTTPNAIRISLPMESIGLGLASRIIFVYEERRAKMIPTPFKTKEEIELQQLLIRDLENIALLAGEFRVDNSFVELWTKWCHESADNPPFYDAKFDGYIGRRREHAMKTSMVINASRKDGNLYMTANDLSNAINTLNEVEVKMGLVFKGMGRSDLSEMIHRSIAFFERSSKKEIHMSEYARYFEGDLDKLEMERVLKTLEVMKLIKIKTKPGIGDIIYKLEVGNELKE